ncbi:MAG TPA: sensor histidine kinase, partial [Clostridiales bacterium UBA8960]|nr:sensor histidine kinase [Clostridiales bacterium UBA8960]
KIALNYSAYLPQIYVNKIRVSRALLNIVENAIVVKTNSDVKEINIDVYTDQGYLFIEIKDNGIGISPENLESVWEAGYSTKQSTGLGLYFVKKIVEDNDGMVKIESEPGIGTSVKVCFPSIER